MAKYRKQIEDWAIKNYDKSFGHSAIVECWDTEDYAQYDHYSSAEEAIKAIESEWLDPMNERYASAWCDA